MTIQRTHSLMSWLLIISMMVVQGLHAGHEHREMRGQDAKDHSARPHIHLAGRHSHSHSHGSMHRHGKKHSHSSTVHETLEQSGRRSCTTPRFDRLGTEHDDDTIYLSIALSNVARWTEPSLRQILDAYEIKTLSWNHSRSTATNCNLRCSSHHDFLGRTPIYILNQSIRC
jgi:hypothetical protein